jgi:predicted DNA-binding transcriptional regulator YafY
MANEVLSEIEDGLFIYETTVNSLDELASWVVSKCKGVKVLEPLELREKVLNLAKDSISNYD